MNWPHRAKTQRKQSATTLKRGYSDHYFSVFRRTKYFGFLFTPIGRQFCYQIDFSSCALSVVKGTGPPMASTVTFFDVGVIIFGE